jgi:hypothetical protein
MCHGQTAGALAERTDVIEMIIQCSAAPNPLLADTANATLDTISEFDERFNEHFGRRRFDAFNGEWMDAMRESGRT